MKSALIGYTGFVGSNILRNHTFDDLYNSSNIADIEGKSYDLVVTAANRAEMWRINQEPEKDLAEINGFIDHIKEAKIKKLVLISTVGVYKTANGVDEDGIIEIEGLAPYGINRYYLEQYCQEHFDTVILRLPGLFGEGLKKNVIYDLLHNNNLDKIHKDGSYQYYNLDRLWSDIAVALNSGEKLINLATPTVTTQEVARDCFGIEFNNTPSDIKPAFWDMRTKHAALFGQQGPYIVSKEEEIADIKDFVRRTKSEEA